MSELPTPITREEQYLASYAGEPPQLPVPITREERYLAKMAGEDVDIPAKPITRKELYYDTIIKNGGGSSVEVEALSVTANGTYTAEEGKAYSPVSVAVENSYVAADEGKVVSNGALVAQTSDSVTANGTVDTTLINTLTVNVPNSYGASDEGKVVSSGALVAQTATSTSTNGTIDTTLNNSVTVNVPTGTARTSADLTASGATVNVPAGLYASAASKSVASGSATTPATTIAVVPAISISSGGLITAAVSASQNVTPTVSAGYVSSGTAGAITVNGSNTQQLTAKAAQTYTPTTSAQTIASGQYLTGAQTIAGDANLIAGNIKDGVSIFGVTGTHSGGGGWELIGEWNETISTSSTSEVVIGTYTTTHTFSTSDDIYAVVVMDKAGKQNGHFVAEYSLSFPERSSSSWTTYRGFYLGFITRYSSSQWYSHGYFGKNSSAWVGIYGQKLEQANGITTLTLAGRYNSSYTATINGNFNIRLFKLPFPQNGNPYNFSFT